MSTRHAARLGLLALLALLAPAPGAEAGTPEDPDVVDATLDALAGNAWADVEKAWVETVDEGTLRVVIEVAVLPESRPGVAYAMVFDADGETFHAALVHATERFYSLGGFDRDAFRETGSRETTGSLSPGLHGRVAIDVPRGALPRNATALTDVVVYVVEAGAGLLGGDYVALDEAPALRDVPLPPAAPQGGDAGADAGDEGGAPASPTPAEGADAARAAPAGAPEEAREAPLPAGALGVAALALAAARRARRLR